MNLICWAWGHEYRGYPMHRVKHMGCRHPEPDEGNGRILSNVVERMERALGHRGALEDADWERISCRVLHAGVLLMCDRCNEVGGWFAEAERLPARYVPVDEDRCRTIGWLRRTLRDLACMLFGHDDRWQRDILGRCWGAICARCGRHFGVTITDRDVHEGKAPWFASKS